MPVASVTTPAIAPESFIGLVAPKPGVTAIHIAPITSQAAGWFSFGLNGFGLNGFVLNIHDRSYQGEHPLLLDYRKFGGWGEHLVSIFIGYLQPNRVLPRNQRV